FGLRGARSGPDQIVIRLDPLTGIRFEVDARRAGTQDAGMIQLDMNFAEQGGEGPTPYEVLLNAAMVGLPGRFTRQDGVEETWRIMHPLVDTTLPLLPYPPGTWGPVEASNALVEGHGRWHEPWVEPASAS